MKKLITLGLMIGTAVAADDQDADFLRAVQESLRLTSTSGPQMPNSEDEDFALALQLSLSVDESRSNSHETSTSGSTSGSNESSSRLRAGISQLNIQAELGYQANGGELIDSKDYLAINQVSDRLRDIYFNNSDVHAGDNYIPTQISSFIDIASKILIMFDDLDVYNSRTLAESKQNLIAMIKLYSTELADYTYEGQAINIDRIIDIITRQCDRSSSELGGYAGGQGAKVWSYTIALALNLLSDQRTSQDVREQIIKHLVDQSIEGMLTQGGCIQGFVNRGFIALLNMLAYYMPQ